MGAGWPSDVALLVEKETDNHRLALFVRASEGLNQSGLADGSSNWAPYHALGSPLQVVPSTRAIPVMSSSTILYAVGIPAPLDKPDPTSTA